MGEKVGGLKWTVDNTEVSFDARKRGSVKILGTGGRADCAMTYKEAKAVKPLYLRLLSYLVHLSLSPGIEIR